MSFDDALAYTIFHSLWQGIVAVAALDLLLLLVRPASPQARDLRTAATLFTWTAVFLATLTTALLAEAPAAPPIAWFDAPAEAATPISALYLTGVLVLSLRLAAGVILPQHLLARHTF